ncbi:unnamed protein product [Sphagnum jensenii]|uniref:Uncharacterized protein n=1 Tax=Sphagnum jensenii TaxID=128206 RepID=A0ABP0X894_9BRYO
MNTRLDCAAYSERAMDMQAKTQCLGLLYQMDFAAHFLELLQPQLQSTSESTNSFHEESICLQWLLDLGHWIAEVLLIERGIKCWIAEDLAT